MRVLPALISVLSFVGTTQAFEAVSVPGQYKDHEIQLPGRFDKPADPGPFPAVILLHGCTGYQEHPPHSTVVEHASWRRVCVLDQHYSRCSGHHGGSASQCVAWHTTQLRQRRKRWKMAILPVRSPGGC